MSFLFNQQYGPGVEEFLKPQELFSLGLVSKGSRIRPQQTAFRQKIKKVIELPSILDMPMRYNSKLLGLSIAELYEILEFLWETQTPLKKGTLNSMDMFFIRAEANSNEANKLALSTLNDIDILFQLKNKGYRKKDFLDANYEPSIVDLVEYRKYSSMLVDMYQKLALYFGITMFKEVEQRIFKYSPMWAKTFLQRAYPLNREIRTYIIETYRKYNNSDDIYDYESVIDRPNNIDGYALLDGIFHNITNLAIQYQDTELYIEYLKQYMRSVPEDYIRQIFSREIKLSDNEIDALKSMCKGFKP